MNITFHKNDPVSVNDSNIQGAFLRYLNVSGEPMCEVSISQGGIITISPDCIHPTAGSGE